MKNKILLIILTGILAFNLISFASADPLISFVSPTPTNGGSQGSTSIYVNVSSSDADTHYTFLDWNNSLVGWWRLDSLFNPSVVSGKVGNALVFDGVDDYVDCGTLTIENGSISVWFKPESLTSGEHVIAGIGQVSANNQYWKIETVDTAGRVVFGYRTLPTTAYRLWQTNTGAISTGNWYHIAVRFDSSSLSPEIYINGVNQTLSIYASSGTPSGNVSDTFAIGRSGGYNGLYSKGTIDQVRIWNRTLSGAEISSIYSNESIGQTDPNMNRTGLVGEWLMDEQASPNGTTIISDSAGSNSGILKNVDLLSSEESTYGNNGTCSNGNCPVLNSSGKFGGSRIFSSSQSQFIQSAYNNNLNFSKSDKMSISLWFNYRNSQSAGLVSNRAGSSSSYNLYLSTTNLILDIANQTTHQTTSAYPVSLNTWYHVVATYNGSVMNLYVNGTLVRTQSQTGNIQSQTTNLFIGRYQASYLNGSLDDVLVFNKALSSSEVLALYNATANQYYNNFTNLSYDSYSFKAYAVDTAGNKNNTETRTVTIQSDSTPPATVTNLQDQSKGQTWIYWNWTNPADADFSQNIIYIDSINVANISNNYYNATGLTNNTQYTITVHTKDTNGNINNTDINSTVRTLSYNSIPVVTTPSITPTTAYTGDDLTCSFTVTDEDADSLSVNYTWYNGTGAIISGSMSVVNGTEASLILGNGNTTKNEIWNCSIKPYDTKDYGTEKSAAKTISNSLPSAPGIDVIPDSPGDNEDLVATIATASTDLDNDIITYSYQWYKNDVLQTGQTFNTLSKSLTSIGEVWKCVVTPNDGTGNGATGQDNVTIVSSDTTAPTITIVNPANGSSLSTGITETWVNITTNENATCRYSNTSSTFSFDEGTNFTIDGNSEHSFLFSGMSDGQTYTLYYKCNDTYGNVNSVSITHIFSVSAALYCGDGSCNNGETCSTCSADCGGCSSGGSGGGGGTRCTENWTCSTWSACVNGLQTRTCIDGNSCGTTSLKPIVQQSCEICSENWECGEWTECSTEGLQVRACNDASDCRTSLNKPAEIQNCVKPTCFDTVQNQDELGIDCGGPCARRCGVGEIAGSVVKVPSPEQTKKNSYGFVLMILLAMLVGMLIGVNRIEHRIGVNIRKSNILTNLHEHHHGTAANPEASHRKEIEKAKLKLLLMNIAHIIIIIVIIAVIYYFVTQ
jgi:hypothetical protein